jgi:hypothetical protein
MKLATMGRVFVVGLALFMLAMDVGANDPIFVKWLVADDPGDETIRSYWQRAEAGELGPNELIDLGTMLFYRGWSSDAVKYFSQALDQEPDNAEAWFRIGLVKHRGRDLSGARSAYKKCLKRQSGHGWANFYLGLLEEQTGEGAAALEHYQTAFKHAPELADPRVNPELLSSKLQIGAQVRHFDGERFETNMPMPFMDPVQVRKTRRQWERVPTPVATPGTQPTAEPTPMPEVEGVATRPSTTAAPPRQRRSTAGGATAGAAATTGGRTGGSSATGPPTEETPYGVPRRPGPATGAGATSEDPTPRIGSTSPEASLVPLWRGLYGVAEAFV